MASTPEQAVKADTAKRLIDAADGWLRCHTGPAGWLLHGELMREAGLHISNLTARLAGLREAAKMALDNLRAEREGGRLLRKDTVISALAAALASQPPPAMEGEAVEAAVYDARQHFKGKANEMHGRGLHDFGRWLDDWCEELMSKDRTIAEIRRREAASQARKEKGDGE